MFKRQRLSLSAIVQVYSSMYSKYARAFSMVRVGRSVIVYAAPAFINLNDLVNDHSCQKDAALVINGTEPPYNGHHWDQCCGRIERCLLGGFLQLTFAMKKITFVRSFPLHTGDH